MTQQKNFNPFELWKDFYNQTSNKIDENLQDESTSKAMGQVLELNLLYKKILNETTEQYFDQVNIPTRNDLASISSLIINVDSKVDDLEELIEETRSNQANPVEIKREITDVKNKIKSLDTKLNQILSLLKTNTVEVNKETPETPGTPEPQQEQLSNP
jgi:polyhydroxyalkanoic acid synthase PhaR subunit